MRLIGAIILMTTLSYAGNNDTAMNRIELKDGWHFKQVNAELWLPAEVPGTVHTDLLKNDRILDPFYRTNEKQLQWIDKVDWQYQLEFEVDEAWLQNDAIDLQFDGLDTYADVSLNGELLFKADNFFVDWRESVKDKLKAGTNELSIYFHSPMRVGAKKLAEHGYQLPAINDQAWNGDMGDKQPSIHTRKPGYHYGWDWGPRLTTSGIWRPIKLEMWNGARLVDVYYHQCSLSDEVAELDAQFTIEAIQSGTATVRIYDGDKLLGDKVLTLKAGEQEVVVPITINNPKRWWTWDLGEPHLYNLRAELEMGGKLTDISEKRLGLRTVRVVQEPDEKGSSFYFELNGVPLYAKGANYIPNDVFIPRVTDETYAAVLDSAVAANMNMIRVWGGGFYENKLFYDICDEQGLLVWQDFMFACSMYPGNDEFLAKVRAEAEYNVRRLRQHPSIAMWCGNNEMDMAWAQHNENGGWGWKEKYTAEQRKTIWADYRAIFHELLPEAVEALSPGTFYWPSSPFNKEGSHAHYTTTNGDIHYWGVWHGEHPISAFYDHIGRFMSEYGFQSFPEFETIKRFTLPEDWDIESKVMLAHQRSTIGNVAIRNYMEQHYHVPESFEDMLYIGQVLQAEAIRTALEAHRTAKPYCMGTLYWQLNDCWPAATWAGLDYYLNWKAMHYFVRKAYEPVMLALRNKDGKVHLRLVSDRREAVDGQLKIQVIDFDGKVSWEEERTLQIPADASMELAQWEYSSLSKDRKDKLLHVQLFEGEKAIASQIHYFDPG
jgi:beta-mannosidase